MIDWRLQFSASCPNIEGHDLSCSVDVCTDAATGHAVVVGGTHDGRCAAVLCARHASEDGYEEFREQLKTWLLTELLGVDGGPGENGAPEVWHVDHFDPLPQSEHGVGW